LLRSEARNAFAGAQYACWRHLGAQDFLDLTRRARSVVNEDALPEPQLDDVLLARHLFCCGRRCRQPQGKAGR